MEKILALLYLGKMFQWFFFFLFFFVSVFTIYFSIKDLFRSDIWLQGERLCSFLKKVRLLDSFIWSTLLSVGTA